VSTATHLICVLIGFASGIYSLPIIVAPEKPSEARVDKVVEESIYETFFVKNLPGSDFFHWAEGQVSISNKSIAFQGKMSPGPGYHLYVSRNYVDNEKSFLEVKNNALLYGIVNTFNGFIVMNSYEVDVKEFTTIIIWCEPFSEFITAAKYQ